MIFGIIITCCICVCIYCLCNGIACDVIANHDEETCRELIINTNTITPTPTTSTVIDKCGHSKEGH